MVTNYARPFASRDDLSTTGTHEEGLGERVIDRLRQVVCGLHGHDTYVQFEQDRMFLRCVSCGHETPGWAIKEPTPAAAVARADLRSRTLARPGLLSERKIA
jgi:hypothetical protein